MITLYLQNYGPCRPYIIPPYGKMNRGICRKEKADDEKQDINS